MLSDISQFSQNTNKTNEELIWYKEVNLHVITKIISGLIKIVTLIIL